MGICVCLKPFKASSVATVTFSFHFIGKPQSLDLMKALPTCHSPRQVCFVFPFRLSNRTKCSAEDAQPHTCCCQSRKPWRTRARVSNHAHIPPARDARDLQEESEKRRCVINICSHGFDPREAEPRWPTSSNAKRHHYPRLSPSAHAVRLSRCVLKGQPRRKRQTSWSQQPDHLLGA